MVPVLKLLLSSIDICVLCLVVTLLVAHCKSQHDVRSWATALHVLVLTWLALRGIFWVLTITAEEEWHSETFYLLYWLPNPLQFASFSLLPLFYGQMLCSRRVWEMLSRWIIPLYITVVASMVMFMVVWSILEVVEERKTFKCVSASPQDLYSTTGCYHMEFPTDAFRMLTGLCFVALAIVVAASGSKVSRLTRSQYRRFLIYQPRALAALNCVLCTVFFSKGVYQVISVSRLWYLPNIPLKGRTDICVLNFFVFLCWDYVPTVLLLLMVAKEGGKVTPATAVAKAVLPVPRARVGDPRNLPNYGLFLEIKKHVEAQEEAAALARQSGLRSMQNGQGSPSEGSDELSSSPVLVNTWLLENSSSFTYSPSTNYGSYSSSTTGGGGCGGDSAFPGNYGFSPSPRSTLAGEAFTSPSAPLSRGNGGRKGFWGAGFWGGLRGRSESGHVSIGDQEVEEGGADAVVAKNGSRKVAVGEASEDGHVGDGDGLLVGAFSESNDSKALDAANSASVAATKSDPAAVRDKADRDSESQAGIVGTVRRWWQKLTNGGGSGEGIAESEAQKSSAAKAVGSKEPSTVLRHGKVQNELSPRAGVERMACGGPAGGERQDYPMRPQYPMRQEYTVEGDRGADGGRTAGGVAYGAERWAGHPQLPGGHRRSGSGTVPVEGGGWRWQGEDVDSPMGRHVSARPSEEQAPYQQQRRQQLQQQLQLQRQQQQQYYQHEQYQRQHQYHHHYQQQQQVQQADGRYQRGAAVGGAMPLGTIGRHPVVAPLRVPMFVASPDGGQRRMSSAYANARYNPADNDSHDLAGNFRTTQRRPGEHARWQGY